MTMYIYGKKINTKPDIKYLGIKIDNKLDWRKHIDETIMKCEKTIPGIATLCQNVFGYTNKARRELIQAIVGARFRYGAAFFAHQITENSKKINAFHRKLLLFQGRFYRSVSYLPATAITGERPIAIEIELFAHKRAIKIGWETSDRLVKSEEEADEKWQNWYEKNQTGAWTKKIIPRVARGVNEHDFYTAQALSGHGVFRAYLYKRKRVSSPLGECGEVETAEHILTICPLLAEGRVRPDVPIQNEFLRYSKKCIKKLWEKEAIKKKKET